jgi:hypothetical protein
MIGCRSIDSFRETFPPSPEKQHRMPRNYPVDGPAIAQAVSRRLPIAAARVREQVRSCGICGRQSGTGVRFIRVLRFPLSILIHRLLHIHHHLSSGAGTISQLVAVIPSGLSLTPPQETKKKKLKTTRWMAVIFMAWEYVWPRRAADLIPVSSFVGLRWNPLLPLSVPNEAQLKLTA